MAGGGGEEGYDSKEGKASGRRRRGAARDGDIREVDDKGFDAARGRGRGKKRGSDDEEMDLEIDSENKKHLEKKEKLFP